MVHLEMPRKRCWVSYLAMQPCPRTPCDKPRGRRRDGASILHSPCGKRFNALWPAYRDAFALNLPPIVSTLLQSGLPLTG